MWLRNGRSSPPSTSTREGWDFLDTLEKRKKPLPPKPADEIILRNKKLSKDEQAFAESFEHIPGDCLKIDKPRGRRNNNIFETSAAPPGTMYALYTPAPTVKKIEWHTFAPKVLDISAAFAKRHLRCLTNKHLVFFNCEEGIIEAVVNKSDKDACTFYERYYFNPTQRMIITSGDQLREYLSRGIVMYRNATPVLYMDKADLQRYIQTASADKITNIGFAKLDINTIRYRGVDSDGTPLNLDLARVRAVHIRYNK